MNMKHDSNIDCQSFNLEYTNWETNIVKLINRAIRVFHKDNCRPLGCSGMFKSRLNAENEYNIACLGVLKCVRFEQICDGGSDSIYSSDCEIMCNTCSFGCRLRLRLRCIYEDVNIKNIQFFGCT